MRAAHTALIGALLTEAPRPIPAGACPAHIEERARHLRAVLTAVASYVEAAFADAAGSTSEVRTRERAAVAALAADLACEAGFDDGGGRYAKSLVEELAGEVSGALERAAEEWRDWSPISVGDRTGRR